MGFFQGGITAHVAGPFRDDQCGFQQRLMEPVGGCKYREYKKLNLPFFRKRLTL
jgi:hypothetical protein